MHDSEFGLFMMKRHMERIKDFYINSENSFNLRNVFFLLLHNGKQHVDSNHLNVSKQHDDVKAISLHWKRKTINIPTKDVPSTSQTRFCLNFLHQSQLNQDLHNIFTSSLIQFYKIAALFTTLTLLFKCFYSNCTGFCTAFPLRVMAIYLNHNHYSS